MEKITTFNDFVNEAKSESYPVEVQKLLEDLISKLGIKKYQLTVELPFLNL